MQFSTVGTDAIQRPKVQVRLGRSLFDTLFPEARTIHRVFAAIAFIVLISLCAKGRFYLPDNPTPITLQTFGVLLTGCVMGWRWGIASVVGYIAIGALGLPLFANEQFALKTPDDGWTYITGVTGGYLIGFVLASGATGFLSQLGFTHSRSLWSNAIGNLLIYTPALIWLSSYDFGWPADGQLFQQGMYVFIPGDLVKLLAASLVTAGLWNYGDRIIDNLRNR